jgi:hypothetical protein
MGKKQMNKLQTILFNKNITIKYIAKKCNRSPSRMGYKIDKLILNLSEIKIILKELNMKFEDIF